jgi:hypothetical protein
MLKVYIISNDVSFAALKVYTSPPSALVLTCMLRLAPPITSPTSIPYPNAE